MNELVQLTTADVSRAIPVTTSRMVSLEFEKEHSKVVRSIKDLIEGLGDNAKSGGIYLCEEIDYIDAQNRKQSEYQMNEQFFMLLVMGFTGSKALKIKNVFVREFYRMRSELLARKETRFICKTKRLNLTDSIRDHVSPVGNFKKFAYGNYTKLVYKRILGMDVKHAKEARKVPENGNLRDYLTIDELDRVQELESKIAGFIEISDTTGKDDKAVYAMVKTYVDSLTK
jgi:Rha family phage regulatory protein